MGSNFTTLAIFFITLIIFHVLLYFKLTGKRFWIIIDYFWVSLDRNTSWYNIVFYLCFFTTYQILPDL